MDDPQTDIVDAINRVAAANSADAQIRAIKKYFTSDASFSHPLCYVPSGPDSRSKIALIYRCYRGLIPRTSFEIQASAWDKRSGTLFVKLIQKPEIRVLSWFTIPRLPMRIYLHLKKIDGKYLIDEQEDLVQPRSALLSISTTKYFGIVFFWLCQIMGIILAHTFHLLGIWSISTEHSA